MKVFRPIGFYCLVAAIVLPAFSVVPFTARGQGTGIEGRVIYQPDRKRFWRYSRYYIKNKKTGYLAETLVSLRGTHLRNFDDSHRLKTIVIDQKDFRFVPEAVAVRKGDSVKFTNSDPGTHNVSTRSSLHSFDVSLKNGDEAVETFLRAGGARRPVVLGCKFHGSMRAWIYVFDHPFFAVTGDDGRFHFDKVPPGDYFLEVVHSAGGLRSVRRITIRKSRLERIDITVSPDNKITAR